MARKFTLSLLPIAWLCLFCVPASADSISGLSIDVTSVLDNHAPQEFDFPDITSTRIDAGIFEWMHGPDPGTNLEFIPGVSNGNQTSNEFDVNFSNNAFYDSFQPTDTITLSLQLPAGWYWNTNFMALTQAIDVQVPHAVVNGGTFTFEMTNLDQVNGNGGRVQYIFDVTQTAPAPEPATIWLIPLGCAALLIRQRINSGA